MNKVGYLVSLSVGGNYGGGLAHTMIALKENPIKWYSDWKTLYDNTEPEGEYGFRIDSEKSMGGRGVQYYDVCILNIIETNATSASFLNLLNDFEEEEDNE